MQGRRRGANRRHDAPDMRLRPGRTLDPRTRVAEAAVLAARPRPSWCASCCAAARAWLGAYAVTSRPAASTPDVCGTKGAQTATRGSARRVVQGQIRCKKQSIAAIWAHATGSAGTIRLNGRNDSVAAGSMLFCGASSRIKFPCKTRSWPCVCVASCTCHPRRCRGAWCASATHACRATCICQMHHE